MLCCHCLTDRLPLMPCAKESFLPDFVFHLGHVILLYGSCCEHTEVVLQGSCHSGREKTGVGDVFPSAFENLLKATITDCGYN